MAIDARLLTVIKSINELGICSVVDLHRATGISRPAIHRMIENLCAHGYTERVNGGGTIRLTSEILALSSGFRPEYRLAEIASVILRDLETRIRWPLTLVTRQDDMMVIQETTRDRNPFVFDNGRVGLCLPIVTTAIGCAYLIYKLPPETWPRLFIWMGLGLIVYFGYAYWHSRYHEKRLTAAAPAE